jgi:CheY-like chemotaxis protein
MQRILIIEDEETLRIGMVRALSKLAGVEVVAAGTLRVALALVDRARPDAVISDLDLPDRFGAELLGELERRGLRIPVTFVSAYTRKFSDRVPRAPDIRLVDKPVSLEKLREIAAAALSARDSVLPPPFGASDYLQLACLGRHSVVITRRSSVRDESAGGRIIVWRGELWDATDEEGHGERAFRRIVVQPGVFRVHTLDRDPGPRTIEGPWEMLMLDALREADEEAVRAEEEAALALLDGPVSPPPSVPAVPPPPPVVDLYDMAFERGVEALFARDHAGAVRAFRDALAARPGDPKATANLERLRALGHVDPSPTGSNSGGIG